MLSAGLRKWSDALVSLWRGHPWLCYSLWSGRWDSNPRLSAWEADVLPLNYSRSYVKSAKVPRLIYPQLCTQNIDWEASTLPLSYTRKANLHVNSTLKWMEKQVVDR